MFYSRFLFLCVFFLWFRKKVPQFTAHAKLHQLINRLLSSTRFNSALKRYSSNYCSILICSVILFKRLNISSIAVTTGVRVVLFGVNIPEKLGLLLWPGNRVKLTP